MVPLLVGRERGLNSSATGWTREGRLNGCAGRFRCWLVKKKKKWLGESGRELDSRMVVVLLVGREKYGWMLALLAGREKDG